MCLPAPFSVYAPEQRTRTMLAGLQLGAHSRPPTLANQTGIAFAKDGIKSKKRSWA